MAKDYQGNNIAIDLAPGPTGRSGQVILYGRDYDTKYVVAPSWASFLAAFVSDLESKHVVVDEDVGVGGEMGQLRYLPDPEKDEGRSYLDVLKARVVRRDRVLRQSTIKRNGKQRASSPLKESTNDTQ